MVYCKGKISSIAALKDLFTRYANCSGQVINMRKSSIHVGGINQNRMNIVDTLRFSIGSLSCTYLVVPIFKGKPKSIYFQLVADRVKIKLAA